jgi:methyl coenzyme M reductase subunit D
MKIDREFDVEKYGKKCEEIERELDGLVRAQSSLALSI